MTAKSALALAILAMVVSAAMGTRTLTQAPQVSAQDLTNALSSINKYAKVPDTSASVASKSGFSDMVAKLQGPAAEIVQAAKDLNSPSQSPNTAADKAALIAFGYQSGEAALPPAGQKLYDAYAAVSNFLFGSA